jgi:hypothetical protein
MTLDVIEKIGQLLTETDQLRTLALTPTDADTEQRSKVSREEFDNLAQQLSAWDNYQQRQEPQPPIYPRDLPFEQRHDGNLYLIDPSKIEIAPPDQDEICTPEKKVRMQEDANKLLKALQKKLEKDLAPMLKNTPIFQGFPLKTAYERHKKPPCSLNQSSHCSDK